VRKLYLIIFLFIVGETLHAQEFSYPDKIVQTERISQPIKVDGKLDEPDWAIARSP